VRTLGAHGVGDAEADQVLEFGGDHHAGPAPVQLEVGSPLFLQLCATAEHHAPRTTAACGE
jgi:hypothetical protein